MSTGIEWTDETWNPVTGCDRVSPGCDHCYALTMAGRLKAMGQAHYQNDGDPRTSGPGFGVTCHPDALEIPLRWRRPRRIFVNSMSDLFHPGVPDEFIAQVFAVMAAAPQHTFQVLTKRPQRMHRLIGARSSLLSLRGDGPTHFLPLVVRYMARLNVEADAWPLPNVWLGTSIENDTYTWRSDHLRHTPAAVRFISAEPLLGPLPSLDLTDIDWLIVGGEFGPGARLMHPDWVRDLRDRCQDERWHAPTCSARIRGFDCRCTGPYRTKFFLKQWGEWVPLEPDRPPFWHAQNGQLIDGHLLPDLSEAVAGWDYTLDSESGDPVVWRRVGKKAAGRLLDGRTWDEMPGGDR